MSPYYITFVEDNQPFIRVVNISYNWLKEYVPLKASPEALAEWLTQAGLEVSNITSFTPLSPTLVIGDTLTCVPHPNADKLKKVTVDVGKEEPLHIICGAPNIAAGQKVIVAPVGTTITSFQGETCKIKKAKIRGEYSEGMICSAYEIGVGEAHEEGILVLDTTRTAGTPATTYFSMPPDTILEIDITPNMGNACSHLGIAREIAAIRGKVLDRPVAEPLIPSDSLSMEVVIEDKTICPRYAGVVIKDVQVGPSPAWLRSRLQSIGVTPINNIVDITNFVMHSLGQPLHAFDYEKIARSKIFVGTMKKKKHLTTLDGTKVELTGKELMIYDEEGPLCMAGIIGGERAKVRDTTRMIFLESAYFAPNTIAKSARIHGIHTESSFRFERNCDIEMPYIALQKAACLIEKLAKGVIVSTPIDHYPEKATATPVEISYSYINRMIGKELPKPIIHSILKRLDIVVQNMDEEHFTALIPPYRVDVKRPADIVEEIVRIHGYSQISPHQTYKGISYPSPQKIKPFTHKKRIINLLTAQGYHEIKTNSLISHNHLQGKESNIVKIANPLSQALDILRPTLLYSTLETVAYNLNRGNRRLKLFEIGKIYAQNKEEYHEKDQLSICIAGGAHAPHWQEKNRDVSLHDLYTIVAQLLHHSGVPSIQAVPAQHPYYSQCIALLHKKKTYAHLGAVTPSLCEKMDIKLPLFFTEISLSNLETPLEKLKEIRYKPLPHAPAVARDISLAIDKKVTYTEIEKTIQEEKIPYTIKIYMTDLYEGKGVPQGQKSYTIHLVIQGKKTFREAEINQLMKRLENALEKKLDATIRT